MKLQARAPGDRSLGRRRDEWTSALAGMLFAATLLVATPAQALDASGSLLHYGHKAWRIQEGELPAMPTALAQTKDGYLWVGSDRGLFRFDGVGFSALPAANPLATEVVTSLLAAHDGDLWIGTGHGLQRLHGGAVTRYDSSAMIDQVEEDAHGGIWFARARTIDKLGPLGQISSGQRHYVGRAQGLDLPFAKAFALGHDFGAWIGTSNGVVWWNGHSSELHAFGREVTASGLGGPDALQLAPDGSLWAAWTADSGSSGLQHLVDGHWIQLALPGLGGGAARISSLRLDRENVLWVGTADHGLFRLQDGKADHFGVEDGLSGDGIKALMEDAEGSMWVATTGGLDRFGDLRVASYSSRDGLAATSVSAEAAAPDGSLWISNLSALEQLRDGHVVRRLGVRDAAKGGQFNAVFVDKRNRVWAGVDDDLAVLEGNRFKRIRMPDGKPIGLIVDMAQDADGSLWALPVPGVKRMVRIKDDRVVAELTPTDPFVRVIAARDGSLWMPSSQTNSLNRYRDGKVESYAYPVQQAPRHIHGLLQAPDGSIVGSSESGLVVWHDGKTRVMAAGDGLPCERLFGVALDQQQTLWLYSACGVLRISAASFRAWWDHPGAMVATRTYGAVDGAQPGPLPFGKAGTVTADGKVWFANGAQLQMVDPARLHDNTVVPQVHIDAILADHVQYDLGPVVRLGHNPADVEIDYDATSLIAPKMVLFRYKLDGHDASWQNAGTRRQAFYTDLKPGHYTFRVIACNNDGLWNMQGASVDVEVPPTFTQTRWFVALCVGMAALVLWTLFQLRLRHVRLRLDARMNERERIARELHDTLLQSAHGLIMVLQSQLGRSGLGEADRETLDKAARRASELVVEGRDRIEDLRARDPSSRDLFASLQAVGQSLDVAGSRFHAILQGSHRPIEHAVKEEVRRIIGEALSNAFRHSQARTVTLRMAVSERALILSVEDDGVGVAQDLLAPGGATRHWGITGMHERAERIGAQLHITSTAGMGTEVQVRVVASRAFQSGMWRSGWFARRPMRRREPPGSRS